ncbi:NAD kinase [hydrothermal vent metagenome]|uniref:NAD kinase n=1 Tax=hydrothermal vent metagenome TaxID=652676 RepID=A0A3B1DFZ5_9ZZZZ
MSKVLLFYKKSSYEIYCLERKGTFSAINNLTVRNKIKKFKKVHKEHYAVLEQVEAVLKKHNLSYCKCHRGQDISRKIYDMVITVGGDGTFLEAARKINKQILFGVNSSPAYSVGRLCVLNISDFEKTLKGVVQKKLNVKFLHRLRLDFDDGRPSFYALNDFLICHRNPAAMSRYLLTVKGVKEEQRSSGIWISTPTGSSGAIYSAGGKIIPNTEKKMQYIPRELYLGSNKKYYLKGAVLGPRQKINITSLIREGKIFADGSHVSFAFSVGSNIKISLANNPIRTICTGD